MRMFRAAVTAMLLVPGLAAAQSTLTLEEAEASLHAAIAGLDVELAEIDRKERVITAMQLSALDAISAENPSLEIYKLIQQTLPDLHDLADMSSEVDTTDELLDFLRPISHELLSIKGSLLSARISASEQLAVHHEAQIEALIQRQ